MTTLCIVAVLVGRLQLFGVEGRRAEDVIHELRALNKTDLDGVVAVALSHSKAITYRRPMHRGRTSRAVR